MGGDADSYMTCLADRCDRVAVHGLDSEDSPDAAFRYESCDPPAIGLSVTLRFDAALGTATGG